MENGALLRAQLVLIYTNNAVGVIVEVGAQQTV
jgi:hypothetical protein